MTFKEVKMELRIGDICTFRDNGELYDGWKLVNINSDRNYFTFSHEDEGHIMQLPEDNDDSIIINKPISMNKVSKMMKRLLDKSTQTLVKAGYLNGDLDLTEEGVKTLNALIFEDYKQKLVAMAIEDLEDEKDNK